MLRLLLATETSPVPAAAALSTSGFLGTLGLSLLSLAALYGCGGGALAEGEDSPELLPQAQGERAWTLRSISALVGIASRGVPSCSSSAGALAEVADATRALAFECIANGAWAEAAAEEEERGEAAAAGGSAAEMEMDASSGAPEALAAAAAAARLTLAIHAGMCAPSARVQASALRRELALGPQHLSALGHRDALPLLITYGLLVPSFFTTSLGFWGVTLDSRDRVLISHNFPSPAGALLRLLAGARASQATGGRALYLA